MQKIPSLKSFKTYNELSLNFQIPELCLKKFVVSDYPGSSKENVEISKRAFHLKKISADDLLTFRIESEIQPTFVLKRGAKLFYGKIPKNMNCSAILKTNEHLCSKCRRCHALSFENGGCQKILDEFYSDKTFKKEYRIKVITAGKRIEKYDFITLGFQTLNQDDAQESFGVMNCDFFELEE